jgi:protein involved in polysaccharide export with SLBB domain
VVSNFSEKKFMKLVLLALILSFIFCADLSLTQGQTPTPTPTPKDNGTSTQTIVETVFPKGNTALTQPTSTENTPNPKPDVVKPKIKEPLIYSGDTLQVIVSRNPEFDWRGQIEPDGDLPVMPYVETTIRALCRTENEIAQDLIKAYSKYLKNPQVTVRIISRAGRSPATVLGAIRTPQRFVLERNASLAELIALSGGITEEASGEVQVYQTEPNVCAEDAETEINKLLGQNGSAVKFIKIADLLAGKEAANPTIHSGDIVTILEANPVYVIGGVVSPQAINFRDGLSISRAIASVGGLSRDGKGSEIRIYRRTTKPEDKGVIVINLEDIRKQKAEDILLRPLDIIDVPQSGRGQDRRTLTREDQDALIKSKSTANLPLRIVN